jgi:hypothetical protein
MSSKYQESTEPPSAKILDLGQGNGRMAGSMSRAVKEESKVETPDNKDEYGFKFDSDNRMFETGARRDSASGKPRPDLLSPFATIRRGRVMELGAQKYGERNWEKGMPLSVFVASANRHFVQFLMGATDEDHLAHCAFNLDAIMHGQEMIRRGLWPAEYNDLPQYDSPRNGKTV